MGRANDPVVGPALPVGILPAAVLARDHAVALREIVHFLAEEHQAIDEMAHA
jgi:hypothetical protein